MRVCENCRDYMYPNSEEGRRAKYCSACKVVTCEPQRARGRKGSAFLCGLQTPAGKAGGFTPLWLPSSMLRSGLSGAIKLVCCSPACCEWYQQTPLLAQPTVQRLD